MTRAAELVLYQRYGGPRPPTDDEQLVIAADGGFSLRRTVTDERAGSFAGTLSASDLSALKEEMRMAEAVPSISERVPEGGIFERVAWAAASASVYENWHPPTEWRVLDRLRGLVSSLTDQPLAALTATLAPGAISLRLSAVGTTPLDVDVHGLEVALVALAKPNVVLGNWSGNGAELAPGEAEPTRSLLSDGPSVSGITREPGWSIEIDLPHTIDVMAADSIRAEVQCWISIDGEGRTVKFVLPLLNAEREDADIVT